MEGGPLFQIHSVSVRCERLMSTSIVTRLIIHLITTSDMN